MTAHLLSVQAAFSENWGLDPPVHMGVRQSPVVSAPEIKHPLLNYTEHTQRYTQTHKHTIHINLNENKINLKQRLQHPAIPPSGFLWIHLTSYREKL